MLFLLEAKSNLIRKIEIKENILYGVTDNK